MVDPNKVKMKLSKEKQAIEHAASKGEYVLAPKEEQEEIIRAIKRFRKEAILHIRINKDDLENIKKKAKKYGVPYQTLIAEILHRFAA